MNFTHATLTLKMRLIPKQPFPHHLGYQIATFMSSSHHLCLVLLSLPLDCFYRGISSMCLVFTFFTLPRLQGRYLGQDVLPLHNCIVNLFISPSLYLLFNMGLLDETFFFLICPCFPLIKNYCHWLCLTHLLFLWRNSFSWYQLLCLLL